eukprot:TRINITY_DN538_c2_g2_i2.p1 TRINITY_DN538_c2_g2~~TRINITY_DN538_c2_g2_i2.p1  ORF type:complete len:230 (+),score=77.92 TRINITY_DN538_c2_g2_i2:64-753(+)
MSLCVPAPALCAAPCVAPCAPCVPRNNNTCNNTQRNKKGEKLITTKKPCAHNSWDNVRTKKGFVYFRCRVCEKQWKAPHSKGLNYCEAFTAGCCPAGDACKGIHAHPRKKSLEERFVQHGASVLARVNLFDHRVRQDDDREAAPPEGSTAELPPRACEVAAHDPPATFAPFGGVPPIGLNYLPEDQLQTFLMLQQQTHVAAQQQAALVLQQRVQQEALLQAQLSALVTC